MVKIEKIMKKELAIAYPETSILEIARMMWNNKFGSVIICDHKDETKPISIVTWSNVVEVVAHKKDPKKTKAKDLMPKELVTADVNESMLDVSRKMVKHHIDRIPITNNGRLVGIVAEQDILAAAPEMIEILSEKLKATIDRPPKFDQLISGICENCEGYSDQLRNVNGRWVCSECAF